MVVNNNFIKNIERLTNYQKAPDVKRTEQTGGEFGKLLQDKISEKAPLKFSKHAESRLDTRNIRLSSEQKEKLDQAVSKAGEKGVKDSLVILDNLAFVVNVRSKTVITAMNNDELKENVFTNIDGAVFA